MGLTYEPAVAVGVGHLHPDAPGGKIAAAELLPVVEGVEFRPIANRPGYCVGDDGSVWSCRERTGQCNAANWRRKKAAINKKHHVVTLRVGGQQESRYVHLLVLEAFIGPRPVSEERIEGCHKDGDPNNNRVENLRWGTSAENSADAITHGTMPRGSRHGRSKLCEAAIPEIRSKWAEGESISSLAREYGVDWATIKRVVAGKRWTHV